MAVCVCACERPREVWPAEMVNGFGGEEEVAVVMQGKVQQMQKKREIRTTLLKVISGGIRPCAGRTYASVQL